MAVLSVTSRGQVTFRREVLNHLGIKPGDKIEVDLLPGGMCALSAARPRGPAVNVFGVLWDRTNGAKLTIDQLGKALGEAEKAPGEPAR
jgi:hypothetical protein